MGLNQKQKYLLRSKNHLATMLKALAHPARIAILQQIIKANACVLW